MREISSWVQHVSGLPVWLVIIAAIVVLAVKVLSAVIRAVAEFRALSVKPERRVGARWLLSHWASNQRDGRRRRLRR